MKVALVHDWLTGMRGGEKCLEVFCELYPDADLFTLVHVPGTVSPVIEDRRIHTSFIQRLPGSARWYRYYLPLMPAAIEALDLTPYDLVLSSSHCVAKGVIPRPGATHVSYLHTPMRYAWDMRTRYFTGTGPATRYLVPPLLNYLRTWDVSSTRRVDHLVANSKYVAGRIERYYRREAEVVHPPVDTGFFTPGGADEDYYLVVSAMVPYKGIELAVRAFNELKLPLKIIGKGHFEKRLRKEAGPTVEFLGWRPAEQLRDYYRSCKALIFPAEEDFGIVPLEANACGRPVIALGRGGALETVVPANAEETPDLLSAGAAIFEPPTGVFFYERSPEALQRAVRFFEEQRPVFERKALRKHALRFERSRFKQQIQDLLNSAIRAPARHDEPVLA